MEEILYRFSAKKGTSDDPANFRPIALELVPLKVLTPRLHDSIFSFINKGEFAESAIQKGFTQKFQVFSSTLRDGIHY